MTTPDPNTVVQSSRQELVDSERERETVAPSDPLQLEEHDETDPFYATDADISFLQDLADEGVISLSHTPSGMSVINSNSHVGVTTLPSGVDIEITPKESVSRLLDLLQYAMDTPADTIDAATELRGADTFIDAFGSLFYAELQAVLEEGIRRDYKRTRGTEESVRGRLDVQRQIQRPTPVPTDFAVEYDAYTADTKLNQAILLATQVLSKLVSDSALAQNLSRQEYRLREFVSQEFVSVQQLNGIELTRLTEHYEDILELTRLVLSRQFFEDLQVGERDSFSLFIDMNSIFEDVVERAFRDAAHEIDPTWTIHGQGSIDNLIEGPHAVSMTPDFVVKNSDGSTLLVGDAKWKTGSESAGDIYQISSYMMAGSAPGVLVYPHQADMEQTRSTVQNGETKLGLKSVQLPTAAPATSYREYQTAIVDAAKSQLESLL
jgi:5-methylcytosine-specific restriction enzyme subunit McrC